DPERTIEISGSRDQAQRFAQPRPPARPPIPGQANEPAPAQRTFSIKLRYLDRKVEMQCYREREVIKQALADELAVKYVAERKKKGEEEARVRAEAEEARAKELARIKEEAKQVDRSGL